MNNQADSPAAPLLALPVVTADCSPAKQLPSRVWAVVLAGGEGERLRALTQRWLGVHRPKQYCAFVGSRSMLQHTLDRAVSLAGAERTLLVVARHHAPEVWGQLDRIHWAQTILQPRNCGTAPGIYLPLVHIYLHDPEAIVLILPSDHFVFPEERFLVALDRVVAAARQLPKKLVLLGARADKAEIEYGWILPGDVVDQVDGVVVRHVESFREKPSLHDAERLYAAGGLWNTMVMAARVKTLWALGRRVPAMMDAFERWLHCLGSERAVPMLEAIYESMPNVSFSGHLVERFPECSAVVELCDVVWSDWGNEDRITESLGKIGKTPLYQIARPFRACA